MPRLDTDTRNIVIGRHYVSESQNAVARLYNVHRRTMSRLLQWYQQSGSTADRQRSGRSRITSAVQDRYIRVLHLRNRRNKRNSIKCPRSPKNIGTDCKKPSPWKRPTSQMSVLWRSTETSASTCKDPMVQQRRGMWPAKLEASLVQRWIKMHAAVKRWPHMCIQTPEWEVCKGSTISAVKVWWCGVPNPTPEKLNWCTSLTNLTPIQRWRFVTTHSARNEPP